MTWAGHVAYRHGMTRILLAFRIMLNRCIAWSEARDHRREAARTKQWTIDMVRRGAISVVHTVSKRGEHHWAAIDTNLIRDEQRAFVVPTSEVPLALFDKLEESPPFSVPMRDGRTPSRPEP